ncbi:MAG: hypothetical protein Tsb0010_04550 [Parvularculaceae bacterium]
MTKITPEIVAAHGLSPQEYDKICTALYREPNLTELGVFSVLWSEHCSYKSSRLHLKKLPTEGDAVIQGPGENAGVVHIGENNGGKKLAAVFKIESHNHPSFIEPYQGAATGVGGILRDVFTMGARPVANLNALKFGALDHPKTKHLLAGVVAGIGGYGNCVGVPTVAGETHFDAGYNENILVNAMNIGIAETDKIFYAKPRGPGDVVYYVGSKTGRDGIHGATMASAEFDDDSEEKRPTVQVGDPFTEKLLIEACLELFAEDAVVAVQDMGAAGLTSSSIEMAGKGGIGIRLDLDHVPQREENMSAYEMLLSESQERMLIILKPEAEEKAKAIFDKWGLDAAAIGETTADGHFVALWGGERAADIPIAAIHDQGPVYDRPHAPLEKPKPVDIPELDLREVEITLKAEGVAAEAIEAAIAEFAASASERPEAAALAWSAQDGSAKIYVRIQTEKGGGDAAASRIAQAAEALREVGEDAEISTRTEVSETVSLAAEPGGMTMMGALLALVASPDLCSRRWIWEQYDSTVMADTLRVPGADAGVVRVHGTNKALAATVDVTPRYCAADPFEGGQQAVAEAWRNLCATGATPLAMTNCLNFGNPERPEIMAQFVGCIEGMAEAGRALNFPVVSGNVSLYNETNGKAIPPTPTIGGVGLIRNADRISRIGAAKPGEAIIIIGETRGALGQSLYLRDLFGVTEGAPPPVDLRAEKRAGDFVRELIEAGDVEAVHDISDGGALVAIAEMAIAAGLGATLKTPSSLKKAAFWFGEDQARYVIAIDPERIGEILSRARAAETSAMKVGNFGGPDLVLDEDDAIDIMDLAAAREATLPEYMRIPERIDGDTPMAMAAEEIEQMIKDALPDAEIEITDLAGDGDHYKARIVSKAFAGLTRVAQHQLVYAALKGKMGGALHALALETAAPES